MRDDAEDPEVAAGIRQRHAVADGRFAVHMIELLADDLKHLLADAIVEHLRIGARGDGTKLLVEDKGARAGDGV